MPPRSELDAPEAHVKDLLQAAWNDANADGVTPRVKHGWVDAEESTYEVTVSNPEESPVNGGETGYSGTRGDGSGPIQTTGGTVNVNVWAKRGWTGLNGNGANPRKAAFLFKTEVERILHEYHDGRTVDGTETTLDYVAPGGSQRFVEDADDPEESPMYRYQVVAGYGYHAE